MEDVPPIRYTDSNTTRVGKSPATENNNGQGILYGLIGLLLLVLIVFAILFGISFFFPIKLHVVYSPGRIKRDFGREENSNSKYLRAARRLQSTLNFSINPCEDFYEFACGKVFVAEGELPEPTNFSYSGYQRITLRLEKEEPRLMDELLTASAASSSKAIEKTKIFYKACINDQIISLDKPKYPGCFLNKNISDLLFDDALMAIYVRKYGSLEVKREVTKMATNIHVIASQIVEEADWLDEETKREAQLKLRELIMAIGFKDNAFNDTALDEMYNDLKIDQGMTYMDTIHEYRRWKWARFNEACTRSDIPVRPITAEAKYSGGFNAVVIHGGMFEEPYIELEGPKALNYGAIGSIIGHEIIHGLNQQYFDEIGRRRNWWSNSSTENFEKRGNSMAEQYSNFIVKEIGLPVNGEKTLNENIADNGGIKTSFRAYKEYLKRNGREGLVPGFVFTNEQLFFIGYGHGRCAIDTRTTLIKMLETDRHAPWRARVNVVLGNQPEFAEAFNCPLGSPMNPVIKVNVW